MGTWSSIRAPAGSPSSRGPFVAELFPSCSGVVLERNQFEIAPARNAPPRSRGFSGALCFENPRSPVGVGLTQPRGGLTIHRLSSLSGGQPMQTTTRGRWNEGVGEAIRGTHHSSRLEGDESLAPVGRIRALRGAAFRSDGGKPCDAPSLQDGWAEQVNELKPSRQTARGFVGFRGPQSIGSLR